MSQKNVELHKRAVAVFNTRDVDGFLEFCDPGIELHSAVTATVYYGHGGVRKWYRDLREAFGDEVWLEPEVYLCAGDRTATFHVLHGRGKQSGVELAEHFAHVHTWRDGRTILFQAYANQEDALGDLGPSPSRIEP